MSRLFTAMMAISAVVSCSASRHAFGRGMLNFDDPVPGGACVVTGESSAFSTQQSEETIKTVAQQSVAKATDAVCVNGRIWVQANATALAVAKAVATATAEAASSLFVSSGCDNASGGIAQAEAVAKVLAAATAKAVATALASATSVTGEQTPSSIDTMAIMSATEAAIAKATSSSELWGQGMAENTQKAVADAVAVAVAKTAASVFQQIADSEACKAEQPKGKGDQNPEAPPALPPTPAPSDTMLKPQLVANPEAAPAPAPSGTTQGVLTMVEQPPGTALTPAPEAAAPASAAPASAAPVSVDSIGAQEMTQTTTTLFNPAVPDQFGPSVFDTQGTP